MQTDIVGRYIDTHSWMYATIAYNKQNDIQLSLPHEQLTPKRENDKAIMQCAYELFTGTSELCG